MNIRLKSLILILSLVLFYAIYYWIVPIVVNIQGRMPTIQKMLKSQFGLNFEIKNPELKMGLIPSIWINADDFKIIDKNTSPLSIKNPKIKIRLLPLFIGKVNIAHFSCDGMNANLKFDKNSRFYLGNYLIIESTNPIISFKNSKILVNDYDIYIKDEQQSNNIKIIGDYFNLLKYNPKKYITFSTNSRIKVNDDFSIVNADIDLELPLKKNFEDDNLTLEGTITNLNLADFSPFIKKLSKGKITKANGIINALAINKQINNSTKQINSQLVIDNLLIDSPDRSASVRFKDKLFLNTIFEVSRNTLNIKNFNLNSKNIHSELSGKINKLNSKTPFLNLNLSINKSKTEDFIPLIPASKDINSLINVSALKKYIIYSDINGQTSIRGYSDKPYITGNIFVNNLYVIKPLPAPKSTVKLTFLGSKMQMNITIPTSTAENLKITGTMGLHKDKSGTLDIYSTPNINLGIAQSILIPLQKIFGFNLGPLPLMNLKGTGNIKLKTEGTNENPHLFGEFNFNNTSLSFNKVDMLLTNSTGTLLFKDKETFFEAEKAFLNQKPIEVKGKCLTDGSLDYNVTAKGQELNDVIKILKNSPLLKDLQKIQLPENSTGKADITAKLTGKAKSIDDVKFGKNIFVEGEITLHGNNIVLIGQNEPIKDIQGNIKFNNTNLNMNLNAYLEKSKVTIAGKIKDNIANINFKSNSLNFGDALNYLPTNDTKNFRAFPSLLKVNFSVDASYKGTSEKLDFTKFVMKGKISPTSQKNLNLQLRSGNIELNNLTLNFSKILGSYKRNSFNASGNIKNVLQKNQLINSTFNSDNFDISALKNISKYPFTPDYMKKNLAKFSNQAGHVNVHATIKNNVFNSKLKLNDISLTYDSNFPIKIYSGTAEVKNDKLMLYKVNSLIDTMPILVDGTIDNIFTNPNFNIYINSKPNQKFIEKYINSNAIYPLKIKGDIIYSSRIHGTKDMFSAKAEINMERDSNIYYMGSTLGDANNPIRIYIDTNISRHYIYVNNFQYDKLISSQNNKEFVSQQLNARGAININKDKIYLQNFRVKTQNPSDAKIFNIIFKKPMIKQGLFTSNVVINGQINSPQMRGELNFTGINIPLLETTIKDISLDFKDKTIDIKSTGEIFSNKILFSSVMKNQLSPPYTFKNVDIYFQNLDINSVIKNLENLHVEAEKRKVSETKQDLNISNLIIEDAKLKADKVIVKNIKAANLLAKVSLNEKLIFSLDNFQFNVASGLVKGDFKHNLLNSNTILDMKIDNVDANGMADTLFDLKNQIFGSLTGEVNLTCNNKTHKQCMDTLSGHGGFVVANGRMPKLGSLEYLLKASNLVKSGITGLSINGIIDLVTPLKTGQFETINGDFTIHSGKADSIQIFSKGKDLSLFLTGSYNFSTQIADMNVFGRLSKKIITILGPIGNASLNTLFNTIPGLNLDETNKAQILESLNKIPGIELNDKLYRIFSAKIYGDINGDNYVQSFKWVE